MKKFLAVIVFAMFFALSNSAQAFKIYDADEYAYSENGVDYRIRKVMYIAPEYTAGVVGLMNDQIVETLMFIYTYEYEKQDWHYKIIRIEKGTGAETEIKSGYLEHQITTRIPQSAVLMAIAMICKK